MIAHKYQKEPTVIDQTYDYDVMTYTKIGLGLREYFDCIDVMTYIKIATSQYDLQMSGDHIDLKLERQKAKTKSNTTNAATPQGDPPPPPVCARALRKIDGGTGTTIRAPYLEMK